MWVSHSLCQSLTVVCLSAVCSEVRSQKLRRRRDKKTKKPTDSDTSSSADTDTDTDSENLSDEEVHFEDSDMKVDLDDVTYDDDDDHDAGFNEEDVQFSDDNGWQIFVPTIWHITDVNIVSSSCCLQCVGWAAGNDIRPVKVLPQQFPRFHFCEPV